MDAIKDTDGNSERIRGGKRGNTAFSGPLLFPKCCIYWHYSKNALTPAALAKARAHFLYRGTFIGATPFSIIA
jgi:hypothetical protein